MIIAELTEVRKGDEVIVLTRSGRSGNCRTNGPEGGQERGRAKGPLSG